METITLNKAIGRTRRETLGGREYIVAPLSMLVPGVLNGSRGPLLYPPELVNRNPAVWNHMPIVVYHPMEQGKPTSARSPEILNKQGIGYVFRSKENGRAEGWFDVENTKRVDPRVYDALVKNQPMELSTGLFTKNQKASPGSAFRGKKYVEIVTDFTPDHLAILPDQKGACSMKDGCGMLINSKSDAVDWLRKAIALHKKHMEGTAPTTGAEGEKSQQLMMEQMEQALKELTANRVNNNPKSKFRQLIEGLSELVGNFNPSQPRDAQGRWSGGGGGAAKSLVDHLTSEKLHDPAKFRSLYSDLDDVDKKQAAKVLASVGLLHPLDAKKRSVMTGSAIIESARGQYNLLKETHELNPLNRHVPFKESDQYKKFTANASALEKAKQIVANLNPLHPLQPRKNGKFIAKPEAKANEGAGNDSHETVKNMQEPGDTTKLANKLAQLVKNSSNKDDHSGSSKSFVKGEPTMAKAKKPVVNEEPVELTEDDREELIDMIVGNCQCDTAMDKETLNGLSDELLSRLAVNAMPPEMAKKMKKKMAEEEMMEDEDEEEAPVKNQAAKKTAKVPEKKEPVVNTTTKPAKVELDSETKFLVNYAKKKMQEEKDVIIEKLTANLDDDDKEEMVETLNEKNLDELELMAKFLPKEEKREPVQNSRLNARGRSNLREEQQPESKGRNFTGAGGALPKSQARQVNNSRRAKEEDDDPLAGPLESPTINYAEVAGYNNGNFIHRNNLGSMASTN